MQPESNVMNYDGQQDTLKTQYVLTKTLIFKFINKTDNQYKRFLVNRFKKVHLEFQDYDLYLQLKLLGTSRDLTKFSFACLAQC